MNNTVTVRSQVCEYSFLKVAGITNEQEREVLVTTAVTMYLDNKREGRFKGKNYEGALERKKGYHVVAPGFSGVEFKATVENRHGTSKLSILVFNPIREDLN